MKIKKGATRIVFVFNGFVVKIPNFLVQHDHFLIGCCANWSERKTCRQFRGWGGMAVKHRVIPTWFCSWFGLFQIQAKASVLKNDAFLNDYEKAFFKKITSDIKPPNFGYYKGRLVCIDYGQKP